MRWPASLSSGRSSDTPSNRDHSAGLVCSILKLAPLAPLPAFLEELRLLGWRDRENVLIDIRSADGRYELISQLAHELVRALPDAIYTLGPDATLAAAAATKTLPIVAIDLEPDPIATGLVENLARPGRNVTGLFLDLPELAGKWLELLGEMVPQLTRVGVLGTTRINKAQFAAVEKVSGTSRYQLLRLNIDDARALEGAFETAARERIQGVVVLPSSLVRDYRARIAAQALERRTADRLSVCASCRGPGGHPPTAPV